jgi:phosphatidate cytidylyltransferase
LPEPAAGTEPAPEAAKAAGASRRKGLLVRLTVAPLVLFGVLAVLWWHDRSGSSIPTDVVLLLFGAGAAYEVVAMCAKAGANGSMPIAVGFAAALSGVGLVSQDDPALRGAARALLLAGAVLATFVPHLTTPKPGDLSRLFATIFPVLYVGFLFSLLRESGDGLEGARRLAFVVVVSKASDIGGWAVGKAIGRHKMIPSVSPGKTWEGTAGGLLFSMGAAVGLWAWLGPLGLAADAPRAAALGLLLGAASIVAGLTHSALKRRCGVKDSSALLPEMGGLLDMVDSILLAAPAAWLWALAGWGTHG